MRSLLRLAAAVALLLLLAAPALAQGRLIFEDPGGQLDRGAIEATARPLINKGALVAVYFVDGPFGSFDAAGEDFVERMIDSGIARADGALLSNVIAIYVSLDDRYSEIAYGDQWSDALRVNDNADVIRNGDLNPGLAEGNYTEAVTNGLTAINAAIENPPTPGGGVIVDTLPVAGAIGAAAAAGGGMYLLSRRRRAAKARADAQQKLKDAREGVGALIADLGRRFADANEKAKYDNVSYTAADVQRVQALQQEAAGRFLKVQERFDDVGEGLQRYEKPSNEQLLAAAAGYDEVKTEAQGVSESLTGVEELRAQLDEQANTAREELDRAKKA